MYDAMQRLISQEYIFHHNLLHIVLFYSIRAML